MRSTSVVDSFIKRRIDTKDDWTARATTPAKESYFLNQKDTPAKKSFSIAAVLSMDYITAMGHCTSLALMSSDMWADSPRVRCTAADSSLTNKYNMYYHYNNFLLIYHT